MTIFYPFHRLYYNHCPPCTVFVVTLQKYHSQTENRISVRLFCEPSWVPRLEYLSSCLLLSLGFPGIWRHGHGPLCITVDKNDKRVQHNIFTHSLAQISDSILQYIQLENITPWIILATVLTRKRNLPNSNGKKSWAVSSAWPKHLCLSLNGLNQNSELPIPLCIRDNYKSRFHQALATFQTKKCSNYNLSSWEIYFVKLKAVSSVQRLYGLVDVMSLHVNKSWSPVHNHWRNSLLCKVVSQHKILTS